MRTQLCPSTWALWGVQGFGLGAPGPRENPFSEGEKKLKLGFTQVQILLGYIRGVPSTLRYPSAIQVLHIQSKLRHCSFCH